MAAKKTDMQANSFINYPEQKSGCMKETDEAVLLYGANEKSCYKDDNLEVKQKMVRIKKGGARLVTSRKQNKLL